MRVRNSLLILLVALLIGASARAQDVSRQVVDLTTQDKTQLFALLYTNGRPATTGIVIMHPRSDSRRDWRLAYFAKAGIAALGMASRHENEVEEEMYEDIMLDIAAGVKYLREQVGVKNVILLGHSGGGSLMTFYANQSAKKPGQRVSSTFTGRGPDLNKFDLPPVNLLIISSAHFGNAYTLVRKIDPSITDEDDPTSVDPTLDMYNPANGFRTPPQSSSYSAEFLDRFDKAQTARVERLTRKALTIFQEKQRYRAMIDTPEFKQLPPEDQLRIRRVAEARHYMRIYRLWAIPQFTDLSLDPSDREVGSNGSNRTDWDDYGESSRPDVLPVETFLDTYSEYSHVNMLKNIKEVTIPTLVITGTADLQEFVGERKQIMEASAAQYRELVWIEGANHPYLPQGSKAGDGKQRDRAAEAMLKFVGKYVK